MINIMARKTIPALLLDSRGLFIEISVKFENKVLKIHLISYYLFQFPKIISNNFFYFKFSIAGNCAARKIL